MASRNDLLLSDKILEDDSPFPKQAVLQILRVMQIILENCHNKSSFDGLEVGDFFLFFSQKEKDGSYWLFSVSNMFNFLSNCFILYDWCVSISAFYFYLLILCS